MLTRIACNGFRSLEDFKLDIRPGVNLLLGPNGSGKTNIIVLLDFISKLAELPLAEAVSALGGAGSIFRKVGETNYEDKVQISVEGYTKISTRTYYKFRLEIEIELSNDRDTVVYSHQKLLVQKCTRGKLREATISPDIFVSYKLGQDGKSKIECKVDKRIETPFPKSDLERMLSSIHEPEYSLLQMASRIAIHLWNIMFDISGGLSLNVIPSKAKEPEDSTTPPRIQPDGSGLYSTLRAAFKAQSRAPSQRRLLRFQRFRHFEQHIAKDAFSKIVDATQFANSSIKEIKIQNDPFDNKLKGSIVLGDENQAELPISAMSDGTVKWLVLTTAIYTQPKLVSIEEPENYLHPLVQMEIIKIFREECGPDDFVFISTHSETILNAARPSEVVIVEFAHGKTTASRVENAKQISREIRRTGFGLGFYYVSGAIETGPVAEQEQSLGARS